MRAATWLIVLALIAGSAPSLWAQDNSAESGQATDIPPLPPGLQDPPPTDSNAEIDARTSTETPPLPQGLGDTTLASKPAHSDAVNSAFDSGVHGFWEVRLGSRLRSDPDQRSLSMAETRLQLRRDQSLGAVLLRVNADLLYDGIAETQNIDLRAGRGWLDLRQAYVSTPLGQYLDLRAGRQILTWGVGDLLFLNDLFPKDWNAFFIGRDLEYLKAPSDAIKLSAYTDAFNVDLVYTPRFDPDRFVDNSRLSLFDPRSNSVIGSSTVFEPVLPDRWFRDDEWSMRAHRVLGAWEFASYGYRGYWKSPNGFRLAADHDMSASLQVVFPRLHAWGASLRGPIFNGIVSMETSRYDSRDDPTGSDPLLPNDQWRFLLGYEQELVADLTLGLQYYQERTLDYDALLASLPDGIAAPDLRRHLLTGRINLLTHNQNVNWTLFLFASPSDEDLYLRASWQWQMTDRWQTGIGFNVFAGRQRNSFFGQFTDNTNVHASLRYGF
ncbi:MAG: hypothetical protein Tsb0027_08760 [Wenzhouxiangellaceae bacterium]